MDLFQAERPTSGSCPAARLAMDDIDDDTSSIEASNFPKNNTASATLNGKAPKK